jgi:hypothetical protein
MHSVSEDGNGWDSLRTDGAHPKRATHLHTLNELRGKERRKRKKEKNRIERIERE